jgi:glycosyltransferase involved in cell wall biosynthesis
MTQFVLANLFEAPNISDDAVWERVQTRIRRDFPWLLTEKHDVRLSGIGKAWSGSRRRDQIVSHAGTRSTAWFFLNALLAWLTHFTDVLRLSRKGSVVALVPSPEAGFGVTLAKGCARRRIRTVVRVTAHTASKSLYVKNSRWRFGLVKKIERFVLRRADLVIPMGDFTYELARAQGVECDKLIFLQFPVPWAKRAEITDLPATPTILAVARLVEEKGLQILLKAMPLVIKELPDARLLIAGRGPYRPVLEKTAEALGIREKVSFLGWLKPEDLKKVYGDASLFALPSIWEEGLGMVFVEAGLMGRPVVASDRGGIRDVIRHGENGLLVPPGNAAALADAIVKVLKDRHLARSMGLAGNRIARDYLERREEAVEHSRKAICGLFSNGTWNDSAWLRGEKQAGEGVDGEAKPM